MDANVGHRVRCLLRVVTGGTFAKRFVARMGRTPFLAELFEGDPEEVALCRSVWDLG